MTLDDFRQDVGGQFGVAFSQDFAGSRVHDRLGSGAAKYVVDRHCQRLDVGFFDLIDMAGGDTTTRFNDDLAGCIEDIQCSDLTAQALSDQFQVEGFALDVEYVGGIESVEDFFGGVTQRAQQYRSRQFATTVDPDEYTVFRIELEVQPRATVRDDASGVQQLARAVRLATVVVKEHAWGTVQLGNDHTLGTIDDKGTVLSHQWDFAHVDFLLFNVLDRFVRRFFVENDQTYFYSQRHRKGHATQNTFFDIKGRFAQTIANVLQGSVAGVADDRENRFEGRMQAHVAELIFSRSRLQEFTIRIQLDGQEVRHIHDVRQLAKVLADTFFLSV